MAIIGLHWFRAIHQSSHLDPWWPQHGHKALPTTEVLLLPIAEKRLLVAKMTPLWGRLEKVRRTYSETLASRAELNLFWLRNTTALHFFAGGVMRYRTPVSFAVQLLFGCSALRHAARGPSAERKGFFATLKAN